MTAAPGASPQAPLAQERTSNSPAKASIKAPIMDAFGNPLELPAHISAHQVFDLLDQALPFEVCLYHRVIPLALEEGQLRLGMVDIHDEQALDYVSRIATYSDRTITPVSLAGHLHQVLLSAYLNHSSQPAESPSASGAITEVAPAAIAPPVIPQITSAISVDVTQVLPDETMPDGALVASTKTPGSSEKPQPQSLEEWELETLFPTNTIVQGQSLQDQSLQDLGIPDNSLQTSTLEVEQPGHLETRPMSESEVRAESIVRQPQAPSPTISQRMTLILDETEIMAQVAQSAQAKPEDIGEPPTLIEGLDQGKGHREAEAARLRQSRDIVEEIPSLTENPALPASLDHLAHGELSQRDWTAIAHLPPNLILQAMLGRMLQGNITRLRMERCRRPQNHGDLAQLFWNPSGVLQPTWKEFSLGAFGGLAKALRELAQLPLGTIQRPIQRGVMRRYQGQPILLLMQFLPGAQVAAIELRLLQGKALREFQQHQGQDLGREALLTAQTLQHQVQQLLDHHQRYPESNELPAQLMTVIGQLEKAMANQTTKSQTAQSQTAK